MIGSYSSPFAVGHKALEHFWEGYVVIEEKVDGSQFSFAKNEDGYLLCRAHKQDLTVFTHAPEHAGMFQQAIETAVRLLPMLTPGWTYRGEYLQKPKHNTLEYARVPSGNIILFDIDRGMQDYLSPEEKYQEADRLSLEVCPLLMEASEKIVLDNLKPLLETEACLGGQKVEGIVLKNYGQYGPDKKVLMAKLVRRDFVEDNREDWKKRNAGKKDIIVSLIERYGTEARWRKAVQHLREQGKLVGAPQDIGLLIGEVPNDIFGDAEGEIKDALFVAFRDDIRRGVTRGLPEWYKRLLAEEFFS